MNYRIFITGSGIAKGAMQLLQDENCVIEIGTPADSPEDLVKKLQKFNPHALIVRQGKITEKVQQAAPDLKVISKHGVGTDNIDIDAATARRIAVMFTPNANFESVAEHTLAMILSLIRKIPQHDRQIRQGIFDKKNYDGLELYKKTIGLIGYGKVGNRLCELLTAFKMNVIVYEPAFKISNSKHVSQVDSLEDIYNLSDIISLHCPLTPETKEMINRESISKMKKGVFIINTARGELVNELDLLTALQSKHIAAAALDVFQKEPPDSNNPLFKLENIIVTTHVAGSSDNSMINMGTQSVNNALTILKGETPDLSCLINKQILQK